MVRRAVVSEDTLPCARLKTSKHQSNRIAIYFTGKTHTMYGTNEDPGVIRMAVEQLFYAMEETTSRQFLMMVSSVCINNFLINQDSPGILHRNLQRDGC